MPDCQSWVKLHDNNPNLQSIPFGHLRTQQCLWCRETALPPNLPGVVPKQAHYLIRQFFCGGSHIFHSRPILCCICSMCHCSPHYCPPLPTHFVGRRAYLMALDRSDLCSRKYTAESACWADSTNRCFWRKVDSSKGICLSADYAEVSTNWYSLLNVMAALALTLFRMPSDWRSNRWWC